MIWWLAFDKKPFQFWRQIWIEVVVILLQLYILLWHNRAKVFMKSHFNVYKFAISRKTFKCFYFCYSRKFLVKLSLFAIFKYDFRIGLIPIVHGLFHLWNYGLVVAFYKIILAFVLYLCLILNQIIIMPEPNSSNGWKMGMTSST